jgi:hypothetical protein
VFETPLLSITLFVGDQNIFAAFELYLPAEAADIFFVVMLLFVVLCFYLPL